MHRLLALVDTFIRCVNNLNEVLRPSTKENMIETMIEEGGGGIVTC